MFVIRKAFIILVLTSLVFCQYIDPDIELCNDLTIDAASHGDDNREYAFKGQNFWTIDGEDLTKEFARPINDRWIGLPTPIDASFVIDDENWGISMIFIVDQKWYLYKERNQIVSGWTADWPHFPSGIITAAMTILSYHRTFNGSSKIVFFHDNNTKYSKYMFKNVYNPWHIITDKSDIRVYRERILFQYTLNDFNIKRYSKKKIYKMAELNNLMSLTAAVDTHLEQSFFGKREFCHNYNAPYTPEKVIFNCPRQARPIIKPVKPASSTDNANTDNNNNTVSAEPGDGSANDPKNGKPNVLFWVLLIAFVLCVVAINTVFVILVKRKYDKHMNASKGVESVTKTGVNKETVAVISDTPVVAEKAINSDTTEEVEADQMIERLKNESQ